MLATFSCRCHRKSATSLISDDDVHLHLFSNMFLNWVGRPSIYIPSCMIIWGMISVLTGICHKYVDSNSPAYDVPRTNDVL